MASSGRIWPFIPVVCTVLANPGRLVDCLFGCLLAFACACIFPFVFLNPKATSRFDTCRETRKSICLPEQLEAKVAQVTDRECEDPARQIQAKTKTGEKKRVGSNKNKKGV